MRRFQRQRIKGWTKPPGGIICDRTSRYGNPFKQSHGLTKEDCIDLHAKWLAGEIEEGDILTMPTGERVEVPELPDLEWLRGHDLGCTCKVDEPCHVDNYFKALSSTEVNPNAK